MPSVVTRLARTSGKSKSRKKPAKSGRVKKREAEIRFSHDWCRGQLKIVQFAINGVRERHEEMIKALDNWNQYKKVYTSKKKAVALEKKIASQVASIKRSARREFARLNDVIAALQQFEGVEPTVVEQIDAEKRTKDFWGRPLKGGKRK